MAQERYTFSEVRRFILERIARIDTAARTAAKTDSTASTAVTELARYLWEIENWTGRHCPRLGQVGGGSILRLLDALPCLALAWEAAARDPEREHVVGGTAVQ